MLQCKDTSKNTSSNDNSSIEIEEGDNSNNNPDGKQDLNSSADKDGENNEVNKNVIRFKLAFGIASAEQNFDSLDVSYWRSSFRQAIIWWNDKLKALGSPLVLEADPNINTKYTCDDKEPNMIVFLNDEEVNYCYSTNKINLKKDLEQNVVYLLDASKTNPEEKFRLQKTSSSYRPYSISTCEAVSIASAISYIPDLSGKIFKMCNDDKFKPHDWDATLWHRHFPSIYPNMYARYSTRQCFFEKREGQQLGWCKDVCDYQGGDSPGVVEVKCRLKGANISQWE